MGSFSILHWLILLLIIGAPLAAVVFLIFRKR